MLKNYVFCPYCGSLLEERRAFHQLRPVCPDCGFVHFRDPKVAVIGRITRGDRLLLIRRGVEPELGKWALPGGYLDAGEMPEEALAREIGEEVGIAIEIDELLGVYRMGDGRLTPARGIVLAYAAVPAGSGLPDLQCLDDVTAAEWFAIDQIPRDLAFESTLDLVGAWQETYRRRMRKNEGNG